MGAGTICFFVVGLALNGQAATAFACDDWLTDRATGAEIPFPDDAGYDAGVYGRHIYSIFGKSLDQPGRGLFVGTLTPQFAPQTVWPHEAVWDSLLTWRAQLATDGGPSGAGISATVDYSYDNVFKFDGLRLTETDQLDLGHLPVGLTVSVMFGLPQGHIPVAAHQSIFEMNVHGEGRALDASLDAVYCYNPFPMPDDALAVFQACVAGGGCN